MRHDRDLRDAFTTQADSFAAAAVANTAEVLDQIIELAAPAADQYWLEAACGPGIISRRLAPHVERVEGVDLTAAMVDKAREEAAAAEVDNVSFSVGDVTDLDRPDGHYDGAVTRFSVHHLPVPGRMLAELARVVRPGGRIVVMDHIVDDAADAAIWSTGIERLRDPSHWSCLTLQGLRSLGTGTDLELTAETVRPLEMDFEDWLDRGGADRTGRALLEAALPGRPDGVRCFDVQGTAGSRTLTLQGWFGVWIRR